MKLVLGAAMCVVVAIVFSLVSPCAPASPGAAPVRSPSPSPMLRTEAEPPAPNAPQPNRAISEASSVMPDDSAASPFPTVTGTVRGEDGQPLANATVSFYGKSSVPAGLPYEVEAEEDGTFSVDLDEDEYTVVARAPNHLASAIHGLTVAQGEASKPVDLRLSKGQRISGRVVQEGEPVSEARVALTGQGYQLVVWTEEGRFEFGELPPGRYHLLAVAESFGGAQADVNSGDEVTLSLETRTVTGVVVDSHGTPSPEQPVVIASLLNLGPSFDPFGQTQTDDDLEPFFGACPHDNCQITTDEDGRFAVELQVGLPVSLGAWNQRGELGTVEVNPGDSRELVLRMAPANHLSLHVVPLDPAMTQVTGKVVSVFDESESGFAADELPVSKDGTVEVSWWANHPIQVLTPHGARLEPQHPLPREVTILPPVEESDDQAVLELARGLPPGGN